MAAMDRLIRTPRKTAAHAGDQHVAIPKQRHPARRFGDRSGGPRLPLAQPPGAEHLGLEEQPAIVGGICRHGN